MPIFRTQPASGRRGLRGFAPGKATVFFLCAALACAGRGASASTYQINIAATNLTVGSTYGMNFELQNGVLANPLRAGVSNFSLLGGTLGSGGSSGGSNINPATGSLLNGAISLATTNLLDTSDYLQEFTSTTNSAVMAFTLNLSSDRTQNSFSVPDFFRFSFFDENGMQVSTTNPDDGVSLLYATFPDTSPSVQTFRNDSPTGPQIVAQIQPSAAPEPGTLALLLPSAAGSGAVWLHYRRKRIPARA